MKIILAVIIPTVLVCCLPARAQTPPTSTPPAITSTPPPTPPITPTSTPIPTPTTTPVIVIPSIEWIALGPSYNGHTWGASGAFDIPVSGKISSFTIADWTFTKTGAPTQALSSGFAFDVLDWTAGKWTFRLDLLTLTGITNTPTAILGNFNGGAHFGAKYGPHFLIGFAYRSITNSSEPRLYNLAAEWRFGK